MPDERTQTFLRHRMLRTLQNCQSIHLSLPCSANSAFYFSDALPCHDSGFSFRLQHHAHIFNSPSSSLQGEAHDAEPHVLPVRDESRLISSLSVQRRTNASARHGDLSLCPHQTGEHPPGCHTPEQAVSFKYSRKSVETPRKHLIRPEQLLFFPLLMLWDYRENIETLATDVASFVMFVLSNKCLTVQQSISHATTTGRRFPSPRAHRRADEQGQQSSTTRRPSPTASCCTERRLQP